MLAAVGGGIVAGQPDTPMHWKPMNMKVWRIVSTVTPRSFHRSVPSDAHQVARPFVGQPDGSASSPTVTARVVLPNPVAGTSSSA